MRPIPVHRIIFKPGAGSYAVASRSSSKTCRKTDKDAAKLTEELRPIQRFRTSQTAKQEQELVFEHSKQIYCSFFNSGKRCAARKAEQFKVVLKA